MILGRCPLSIFCSRGTPRRDEPTNPESITARACPGSCWPDPAGADSISSLERYIDREMNRKIV